MVSGDIRFKKVSDWLRLLNEPYGPFEKWIKRTSGASPEIVRAQKSWYRRILSSFRYASHSRQAFSRVFDAEAEVIIARAPARVNLVGMAVHKVTAERSEHIDHGILR